MQRFLRYSLEKGRKIRAVYALDGQLLQTPITVLAYDGQTVTVLAGGKKKPLNLPLGDLLSCDYARGDHGED